MTQGLGQIFKSSLTSRNYRVTILHLFKYLLVFTFTVNFVQTVERSGLQNGLKFFCKNFTSENKMWILTVQWLGSDSEQMAIALDK